ncbi:MAG: rod shape-determining protein MreC [Candidatus Epulonipiscioides saccharophilum]|nr:MAG: rod shape-determining protein MreC [Epulopiscium sp. AS2M-Bin001]
MKLAPNLSPNVKKSFILILAVIIILSSAFIKFGNINLTMLLGTLDDILTYPVEKIINSIENGFSDFYKYFENIEEAESTIKNLKYENDKLLHDNTQLEQLREENILLKELLDMHNRYTMYPSVGANVIGKDPGNWYKSFNIDKGSTMDVHENDIVLANGGLVGIVSSNGPFSATVLSIIDDRSSISIELMRTGETGILNGQIELSNKGLLSLEVDINTDIIVGDRIITSHISDKFPPGILVGEIIDVTRTNNGLVQNAIVKPVVDFQSLKYVLLIKKNEELY